LRITFLAPPVNLSGGIRVIALHGQGLQRMGHEVTVVSQGAYQPPFLAKLRNLLAGRGWPRVPAHAPSHLDGAGLRHIVLDAHRPIVDRDVPDGDVVIASWWETAEWVAALAPSKGRKFYFVQHHEVVFLTAPQARVRATYRLPLRKIVIARWLAEVMRDDYGDQDCALVPNSVDHQLFHAPPRNKQTVPTVGLLYIGTAFKGLDVALRALRSAQARLGAIRVHAFCQVAPADPLPTDIDFASLVVDPPQDQLRDIYAACDVWLTASHSEGFNLPAMEAMACRTPVVSTATGWPAEAVRSGLNGWLCEVGNADQLADGLVQVLSLDPEAWRAMSEAAWNTVKDSTWTDSTRQFEQALQAGSGRPPRDQA
jgi:glycosyltransferase involved in cell wall biosynthesis